MDGFRTEDEAERLGTAHFHSKPDLNERLFRIRPVFEKGRTDPGERVTFRVVPGRTEGGLSGRGELYPWAAKSAAIEPKRTGGKACRRRPRV